MNAAAPRADLLGLPIDPLTLDESVDRIEELVAGGGVHQHVVLNAAKVVAAVDDPALADIVRSCSLVNADGLAVVWAARLLGYHVPERVTGIDLMGGVLARAAARGWGVYFLGARSDVVQEVVRREQVAHPGLVVAGWRDGYWEEGGDEEAHVVAGVAASGAKVLLLAIPSPRKERFLSRHLEALAVPVVMGVGGSFDVVAGRIRRAPLLLQRLGLEWFYRLAQEPRRLLKRYLVGNTRFVLLVGGARLRARPGTLRARS